MEGQKVKSRVVRVARELINEALEIESYSVRFELGEG